MVQSSGKDMATIAQMLKTGTIKPYLSQVFKFDEMGKAHQQLESGRTVGKLVVTL
jgi:NADPH:quinone reductase-like Zn-dependent oxidoreductase